MTEAHLVEREAYFRGFREFSSSPTLICPYHLPGMRRAWWAGWELAREKARSALAGAYPNGLTLVDIRAFSGSPGLVYGEVRHDEPDVPMIFFKGPVLCIDCGQFPADLPSKLCPGCAAYREHQR